MGNERKCSKAKAIEGAARWAGTLQTTTQPATLYDSLVDSYEAWCRSTGTPALGRRSLSYVLVDCGYRRGHVSDASRWWYVRVPNDEE